MVLVNKKGGSGMIRRKQYLWLRSTIAVCVLSAMVLLVGCASAKFIKTGPSMPAKPDDCDIEIFTSKLPDRQYEELGIIEGDTYFGADSLEEVLPKMKREACRAGGDAIILKSTQKTVEDDISNLNVIATVVRWTD